MPGKVTVKKPVTETHRCASEAGAAHEPRTCQTHTAFALNWLDEYASDAPRTPDNIYAPAARVRSGRSAVSERLGHFVAR